MRYALALVVLGHGIAHLPGFLVGWELASFSELPFRTTVIANAVDVGTVGARIVGAGWLIAALMFVVLAAVLAVRPSGWPQALPVAVAFSTLLCVLGWPEAKIGLAANGVMALVLSGARLS